MFQIRVSLKNKKKRMANSIDQDELAHYEPSHLDLHRLLRYWFYSAELNVLRKRYFDFLSFFFFFLDSDSAIFDIV